MKISEEDIQKIQELANTAKWEIIHIIGNDIYYNNTREPLIVDNTMKINDKLVLDILSMF